MTVWNRVRELYLNVNGVTSPICLLAGTSTEQGDTPEFVQGDKFPLHLYFRKPLTAGDSTEAITLPGGSTISVALKVKGSLDTGSLLAFADAFTVAGAGDLLHYEGVLDLNTAHLATALQGEDEITARMDVEVATAGNTDRSSFQFDVILVHQAYSDEGVPEAGDPVYPTPSSIFLNTHAEVVIAAGVAQVVVSGLGLTFTPASVLTWVSKPAGGANIFPILDHSTVDDDGFTVDLSGATPGAGYKLHYLLIKEH